MKKWEFYTFLGFLKITVLTRVCPDNAFMTSAPDKTKDDVKSGTTTETTKPPLRNHVKTAIFRV